MPVTMTIKQVPDRVADRLRSRAAENRRSLQRELLLIIEQAADESGAYGIHAPAHPVYLAGGDKTIRAPRKPSARPAAPGKLTLEALWRRADELGGQMPSESAEIVRRDRDARDGR